eukprot:353696-Chlamydomonas_euryale.AAC.2
MAFVDVLGAPLWHAIGLGDAGWLPHALMPLTNSTDPPQPAGAVRLSPQAVAMSVRTQAWRTCSIGTSTGSGTGTGTTWRTCHVRMADMCTLKNEHERQHEHKHKHGAHIRVASMNISTCLCMSIQKAKGDGFRLGGQPLGGSRP